MTSGGIERFQTPVVKDEQLHTAERPQQASMAAVAAGECKIGEEFGPALVEDGTIRDRPCGRARKRASSCRRRSGRTGSCSHGHRPAALVEFLDNTVRSSPRTAR